jgi:DNA invertase Pin-like site-specific DNA recombinase
MIYGYARISTPKQSIDRQIRNIKSSCPAAVIVQEAYTGTKLDREQWNQLSRNLRTGDTIIFDSVSRMSRNAAEGYAAYEELYKKGINLVFLKEPHINTQTFKSALSSALPMTGTTVDFILEGVNKYPLALAREQIKIAFEQAEKEVADLHQRTREGMETARLNGKQIGQTDNTARRAPDCVTEVRMGNTILTVSGYFKPNATKTAADKMAKVIAAERAIRDLPRAAR